MESQHYVTDYTIDDVTVQHYPDIESIWSHNRDNYLINLLKGGINCSSSTQKSLKDMTENECDIFLKNKVYTKQAYVRVSVPKDITDLSQSSVKTDSLMVPLSLENNNTLAILDKFGAEFSVPVVSENETLPFDKQISVLSSPEHTVSLFIC